MDSNRHTTTHVDALASEVRHQEVGTTVVEEAREQARGAFENRGVHAQLVKRMASLQPEQPTTDDRGVTHVVLLHVATQRECIGRFAQYEHTWEVSPRNGGHRTLGCPWPESGGPRRVPRRSPTRESVCRD